MATRASFGIQNEDGTVTSSYVHFDGYPSHTGKILCENYNTEPMIRELLSYGDASQVNDTIENCVFYHRDRSEKLSTVRLQPHDKKDWPSMGQEYFYLWVNNQWHMNGHHRNDWIPLGWAPHRV